MKKARKLTIGPRTMKSAFLGPCTPNVDVRNSRARSRTRARPPEVLLGGRRPEGELYEHGWFYEPTVTWATERIEAGYAWVTPPQRVFDELPFGGWKASGFGKEHGIEALDRYMLAKAVVVWRSARRLA